MQVRQAIRYLRLERIDRLPDLSTRALFKAVLVAESVAPAEDRSRISRWLVRAGCRYLMACGRDCEAWSDAVRTANLERIDLHSMRPEDFVMTTAHPGESLRAVFWFAKNAARHPEVAFAETLVIHLGGPNRSAEYELIFRRA